MRSDERAARGKTRKWGLCLVVVVLMLSARGGIVAVKQRWNKLSGPVRIGLTVGLLGALLTVIGLFVGDFAPLTVRSFVLGILIGGGSWGVVSWAIAAAASDAMADRDT